ncbi:hypothetical protein ACJIZ3_023700 [Penstemon smallii]|uniref:NAC domain-containing protein n=1 Tax=Penstemon smallii TaxID=265156 RepID=A0ABD3TPS8_9LAMI
MNEPIPCDKILEVNIYEYNPQQLSEKFLPVEENVWYFFTPRDRKFQNCARVNRVVGTGNWKATSRDKPVRYNGEIVGSKKVLVFYDGGKSKTNWIMYEYTIKEYNLKRKNTNNMRSTLPDHLDSGLYYNHTDYNMSPLTPRQQMKRL